MKDKIIGKKEFEELRGQSTKSCCLGVLCSVIELTRMRSDITKMVTEGVSDFTPPIHGQGTTKESQDTGMRLRYPLHQRDQEILH